MWSLQCRCPNHHVICVPDVRFAFIGSNIATTTECQIECPLCIADSSSTLNKRDWWHFHVSNLKPWIKHWRYRAHNKTQYNNPCSNNDFKTGIYYMQMFTAFASSKPTNNMFQACILFVYFRSFSALCLATMWTKYTTTNPKKGRMHHVVDFFNANTCIDPRIIAVNGSITIPTASIDFVCFICRNTISNISTWKGAIGYKPTFYKHVANIASKFQTHVCHTQMPPKYCVNSLRSGYRRDAKKLGDSYLSNCLLQLICVVRQYW